VVASDGEPLTTDELHHLDPNSGQPISVGARAGAVQELRTVALSSSGRAIGILAMHGSAISTAEQSVLNTFANDAALALERAQLREQALRTKILEEADRFRKGLLGAVSHDLRTPLATIKVASSTLANQGASLAPDDVNELTELIEVQTDRLTRLVNNLLEMTRIEAGVLTLHRTTTSLEALIDDARAAMGSTLSHQPLDIKLQSSLPLVDVDDVLIGQALINLIDNAVRHAPENSVITIAGEWRDGKVILSVGDHGPGVPRENQDTIFDRFTQLNTGGRAGLGLTIVKTFVEAHDERVWYEDAPGGGARFLLSLAPAASEG